MFLKIQINKKMNKKEFEIKYGKYFIKNVKNISECETNFINDIRDVVINFYESIFKIEEQSIQNILDKYNCFKISREPIFMLNDLHIGYFVKNGYIHMPNLLPTFYHEMAHFVEMNDLSRLLKDDFGFDTTDYNYYNSYTLTGSVNYRRVISCSIRETRVRAIENIIYLGFIKDKDKFIEKFISKYENKYILNIKKDTNINFGRFKSNKEFEEYLLHTAEKTFDIYNKEKILFEFDNRIKYVLENSK